MKVAERSLTQFILSCAKGKGFELTEKGRTTKNYCVVSSGAINDSLIGQFVA